MIKVILWLLGLLCIVITILWFTSSNLQKKIEGISSLLSVIASILTLTIFLQFYNEFEKTKNENKEKLKIEKARLNSRMVALGSEIINNIQLCNLFESDKTRHVQGIEVPNVYFEYSVTESMIINGEITFHKFRAELTSLISQMKSINNLILTQQQLMLFKNFAPENRHESIKSRTILSMKLLHEKVPLIKKQLIDIEPLFKELWNNPDKYIEENYLKEKMLPEALIR